MNDEVSAKFVKNIKGQIFVVLQSYDQVFCVTRFMCRWNSKNTAQFFFKFWM